MGMIIAVYSKKVFKEYRLPSVENADETILLGKSEFGLLEDLVLRLEVLQGQWRIQSDLHYWITNEDGSHYVGEVLKDQDVFFLECGNHERISLIIKEISKEFRSYEKYDIRNAKKLVVGKGPKADICYDYKHMVSDQHAILEQRDGCFWIINDSPNGTYVNSKRIDTETRLAFGDYINIMGLHMVFLDGILAIDKNENLLGLHRDKLGDYTENEDMTTYLTERKRQNQSKRIYHRAPRRYRRLYEKPIIIHGFSDQKEQRAEIPMMFMLMTLIFGMVFMTGQFSSVLWCVGMGLMGSVMLCMSLWYLCGYEKRKRMYRQYFMDKEMEIREQYKKNQEILEERYPSAMHGICSGEQEGTLWNRNPVQKDFLVHRLGVGDRPFQVSIEMEEGGFPYQKDSPLSGSARIRKQYQTLKQVPITLDLGRYHRIGMIGGEGKMGALAVARTIAAQIAVNHCYTDVKMGFFYHGELVQEWEALHFAKWLPHVWSEDKKIRFLASGQEEAKDVFYELTQIFRTRSLETEQKAEKKKPYYVLFVTDSSMLEEELLAKYVFDQPEAVGLTTIFLAERYEELPNRCELVIENDDIFCGMYDVAERKEEGIPIAFDQVEKEALLKFAQSILRIRVPETEMGGTLPSSVSFLEMVESSSMENAKIQDLWAKNRAHESIRGMLGEKAGGRICYLDLHEKYHGPHGLIAGTTGSGKTELLKTLILSLALQYSPEEIGFFLIDFKGGGMSSDFCNLPHMMGQISNLSGNQIQRAMIALKSENRRRQHLFHQAGVSHIDEYRKSYKRGQVSTPMPHLLVIIDEFAELKKEAPEFLKELISVAQVGRSLGMHLILSTQRPGGLVDDHIWSNSRFRICLRVQDRRDSMDVLHRTDAVSITQPGCGYLQVGNDEVYEQFQSAFTGTIYAADHEQETTGVSKLLRLDGKVEQKNGRRKSLILTEDQREAEMTQLEVVKEWIIKAAKDGGYEKQPPLWMPVLSDHILLESLLEDRSVRFLNGTWQSKDTAGLGKIPIGKADDPKHQRQAPLYLDFLTKGHLAICGSGVSGKSTMIQTILYALISDYTPEEIHLYGIDANSRMMHVFGEAPQVGGILSEEDRKKMSRLFSMLKRKLEERKKQMGGGNYEQYVSVHKTAMPAIILLIDEYAAWKEKTGGIYEETLLRLAKEGMHYGIYLVVSGYGFHMNDLPLRLEETMGQVLCLNLPDKYAYGNLLHQPFDLMPERGIKGRGLALVGQQVLEFQTALCVDAKHDYERLEKIQAYCHHMAVCWKGKKVPPIPEIPKNPTWEQLEQVEEWKQLARSQRFLPVGYDTSDASIYGIDLLHTYCYMIWGTKGSGKTNYMRACLRAAQKKNGHICIIDGPKKEWKEYKGHTELTYLTEEEEIFDYFKELIPEIVKRNQKKQQLIQEGYGREEIFNHMSKEEPYIIFLPDMSWFISHVYEAKWDMTGFLENVIEKGSLHHIYFIGELSLEQQSQVQGYPLYELFASYKNGIQFGGNLADNPVLTFEYLSFREQTRREAKGIGQISDQETWQNTKKIIVPLVTGGERDAIYADM